MNGGQYLARKRAIDDRAWLDAIRIERDAAGMSGLCH
jgi:hypothetical protein